LAAREAIVKVKLKDFQNVWKFIYESPKFEK
jgi:hypothetical protein